MNEDFGYLVRHSGYITAVMERDTPASVDQVWNALADESERVKWLAPGTIELKTGGRARLDFKDSFVEVDSTVTACEAPHLLEFSWSGKDDPKRPIRFELGDNDHGCRIKLTVSIPDDEVVGRSCAGWEAHLTMLQAAALGVPIKFPFERFKECRAQFEAKLAQLMMAQVEVVRL